MNTTYCGCANFSSEEPGKIQNFKYQIPNKSQIPIFNAQTGVAMPLVSFSI
jgi:hypothetical protein